MVEEFEKVLESLFTEGQRSGLLISDPDPIGIPNPADSSPPSLLSVPELELPLPVFMVT